MAAMIITVETEARSNNSLFPLSNNNMIPADRISVALSKTKLWPGNGNSYTKSTEQSGMLSFHFQPKRNKLCKA